MIKENTVEKRKEPSDKKLGSFLYYACVLHRKLFLVIRIFKISRNIISTI